MQRPLSKQPLGFLSLCCLSYVVLRQTQTSSIKMSHSTGKVQTGPRNISPHPPHHQINRSKICQDIALTETNPGGYMSPRNSATLLRISKWRKLPSWWRDSGHGFIYIAMELTQSFMPEQRDNLPRKALNLSFQWHMISNYWQCSFNNTE